MTVSDSTLQNPSDARQSPRTTVSWRARVMTGPQTYEEIRVLNISIDGLGLVCERAYPAGTVLQLAVAIPDPKDRSALSVVILQAKVVFHVVANDKFRIGTRYTRIDDAARALIDHWVSKG